MATLAIYTSAAGSGKTHTLVYNYLALALEEPVYFKTILAITFTNQATQEMKQRILQSLYAISSGQETPLAKCLMVEKKWTWDFLQEKAKAVFIAILHQYSYFNVSTIDSFLQSVVRNFTKELGIQQGFTIEMDQDAVLDELIERVIQMVGTTPTLKAWLIEFAEHNITAGSSWDFKKSLKKLGQEIFREIFCKQQATVLQSMQQQSTLLAHITSIKNSIKDFEKKLQHIGQAAILQMQEAGLSVADFAFGKRGVAGYLEQLSYAKKMAPTQRALAAKDNVSDWYTKKHPQQATIKYLVENGLQEKLKSAIDYYHKNSTDYHTARSIMHFMYALGVLDALIIQLRNLRIEKNILLVSDTNLLLQQIIGENETPFVYEKIGAFYHHFLLDEFQDISDFQWANLKPLLTNGLAMGHCSMLVGDAKQSIYRWRGSNWQLLAHQIFNEVPDHQAYFLLHNWRSLPAIVQFNNTFFAHSSHLIANYLKQEITDLTPSSAQGELIAMINAIEKLYMQAYQKLPEAKLVGSESGFAQVMFLKEESKAIAEKKDWRESVKERLPSLIASLQEEGMKPSDITFLVRNHAEARSLRQFLLLHELENPSQSSVSYATVAAASFQLGQNPAINLLICALRYLANNEDQLALTTLCYLYQTQVAKMPSANIQHDFFQQTLLRGMEVGTSSTLNEQCLPMAFMAKEAQKALKLLPLYPCLVALIDLFKLSSSDHQPFIAALQDAVMAFIKQNPPILSYFLTWWDEQGSKLMLSGMANTQAMRIMTIHQAKGLQFPVTIIPFGDWLLDHPTNHPPTLWCQNHVSPFSHFPLIPVQYAKSLNNTHFAKDYYVEKIQNYLDQLNLLYVAFTRAEKQLYIFARYSDSAEMRRVSDLLYQTMQTKKLMTDCSIGSEQKRYCEWENHCQIDAEGLSYQIGKKSGL